MAFYKMQPSDIAESILETCDINFVNIQGKGFVLFPGVYPSQKFRTTNFLLSNIADLVKNKHVCDMGCGMGIVGQFALFNGASTVIQCDINPRAVKNAAANKDLHSWDDHQLQVFESNCFAALPRNYKFDVIIFNIPFHSEPFSITDPVEYALHDPGFCSLKSFLIDLKEFSHNGTETIIAFSNKGDTETLEYIFDSLGFEWSLWKQINENEKYDNRLYHLKKTND